MTEPSQEIVEVGGPFEVSVVLPCRNEEATLATCVVKAQSALRRLRVRGEIIVVDNGSTDRSTEIAVDAGARVVREPAVGYGNAIRRGLAAARAPWVIIADADDSYDLAELGAFVGALGRGADLVMGTRLRGAIRPGAMPWLHRWVGNPALSGLLRMLFGGEVSDAHCGLRAITASAARRMRLRSEGMELASEMVIKAMLEQMRVAEVPITLHVDGRRRPPHLRTFRDGWRHLRLMLLLRWVPTAR